MPGYARDPSNIASAISVNPAGNISATNVESALYELDLEKALKTLYQSASTAGSGSGQLWMDSVNNILYVYNGTNWTQTTTPVNAFQLNTKVVDANYTLGSQYNAISAGPITINSGVVVEIPSGSSWVIV